MVMLISVFDMLLGKPSLWLRTEIPFLRINPTSLEHDVMTQSVPANPANEESAFLDRRDPNRGAGAPGVERRQFSNSHEDLSPRARELAVAIDEYKIRNRRRFITYEEILAVVDELGYVKNS